MPQLELLDISMDDEGEISIGGNGDILVARDEDVVSQEIIWRLKTTRGDWILEPQCGADLESLVGKANSRETGALMETLVSRALTHDGYLVGELQEVRATPVNREQIAALINIEYGDSAFTQTITLDLKEGVL